MKHYTVNELKLVNYKSIHIDVVAGTRPRIVLLHKDQGQKYFFKTYSHNPREVWAECLASHIAEAAGIKAQKLTIKTASPALKTHLEGNFPHKLPAGWRPIGTLARNIFPKHIEQTYGMAILGSPNTPMKLSVIEQKIRSRYYAPDDLLQDFSDMIVFDVLIGNMDRHHENWAICEDKRYRQTVLFDKARTKQGRYFTPLFDHGSSLMFELDEGKVKRMTENENLVHNYIKDNKFGFILSENDKKENPIKILEEQLESGTAWKPRIIKSLEKILNIAQLELAGFILKMPSHKYLEYSLERRNLLYKTTLMRYNKLQELYERAQKNESTA